MSSGPWKKGKMSDEERRLKNLEKVRRYNAAHPEKLRETRRKTDLKRAGSPPRGDYKARIKRWQDSHKEHRAEYAAERNEMILGPRHDDLRARLVYVIDEVFHTDAQRSQFVQALVDKGYDQSKTLRSVLYHRSFDKDYIAPYYKEAEPCRL